MSNDLELSTLDRIRDEADEETVRRLIIRKQNLIAQLELIQQQQSTRHDKKTSVRGENVRVELVHDQKELILEILAENEQCRIHGVIVFAEGIFSNGESHAVELLHHQPGSPVRLPLPVQRNSVVDLHVNVLLDFSPAVDRLLRVVEIVHQLPNFARFKRIENFGRRSVTSYRIKFRFQERIQLHQIDTWVTQNFILPPEILASNEQSGIDLSFEALPSMTQLRISFAPDGLMEIETESLDLAGELIQHLATFLKVPNLSSDIEITEEHMTQMLELMQRAQDLQEVRQRLTVGIANQVQQST